MWVNTTLKTDDYITFEQELQATKTWLICAHHMSEEHVTIAHLWRQLSGRQPLSFLYNLSMEKIFRDTNIIIVEESKILAGMYSV